MDLRVASYARGWCWMWAVCVVATVRAGQAHPPTPGLALNQVRAGHFEFGGVLGRRIAANVENWLLRAPRANPGMLEMFRVRDRQPAPDLVPWAGEFVGKYLISAIQTLRMTDDVRLKETVAQVVRELMSTQAEDGYLGPFPKAQRLRGNWDLWGHYHCLLALLMWHEMTGDNAALASCRRAADLVCQTFLDTKLRVIDVGSAEMNMAIIHGLGWLYRVTEEPRYRRMMREIEIDWQKAGDYLRAGLDGREFYQSPRPRWESLHDLQGLVELYLVSGEAGYQEAFDHHWRSIARWDARNTGGFSSGEQATGNPYAPTAIETCCTVAWMALSLDMLRLNGDARAADALELATFNAAAGAQHPSGGWWTYNTPMDGKREASAHTIVFQARAGTPELNCCSVNGPRSLGMLSEWAVMAHTNGLAIDYFGPFSFKGRLPDGTPVGVRCESDYPLRGEARLVVELPEGRAIRLLVRIPGWSARSLAQLNGQQLSGIRPGAYLELPGCKNGDVVTLELDLSLRFSPGDREAAGRVSVFRGPLLLAWDQRFNEYDENQLPLLDLGKLNAARLLNAQHLRAVGWPELTPWLVLELPTSDRPLRLCDFACAGATGTRYRSWLPTTNCPPPLAVGRIPRDGAAVPPGRALFRWTAPKRAEPSNVCYRLVIPGEEGSQTPLVDRPGLTSDRILLSRDETRTLAPGRWHSWKVISSNAHGCTTNNFWLPRFRVDEALPPLTDEAVASFLSFPKKELIAVPFLGQVTPKVGRLLSAPKVNSVAGPRGNAAGAVELDGVDDRLVYGLEAFPEADYSLSIYVRLTRLPEGHLGQVFSAWAGPMDDPLRVCVDGGKLFARLEAGQGYSTEGVQVSAGRWYHVAAVKSGDTLKLFVDGQLRGSTTVPEQVQSAAQEIALGGNPHYAGNEFLAAQLADFVFYGYGFEPAELQQLYQQSRP